MGRPDLASRALKTVRWTVFTRRDVGRRARAVQIRPMFSRRRLLQIKRCNPLRGCILVGPAGFEPTQWRSQSPLPYRLATAQQKKRPRSIITVRSLVGCLERFELSASRATIWRANQLRYTHHNVPEGIRTPDPRLRRPLLYPTELQTHKRVMGIEPTYLAWKASVLPLNYTRKYRGDRIRTCGLLIPNQAL